MCYRLCYALCYACYFALRDTPGGLMMRGRSGLVGIMLSLTPLAAFSVLDIRGGGLSSRLGVGGGSELHIVGTDLGDPFNPPLVLIGNNPNPSMALCNVESFTSNSSRFHCTVDGNGGLPTQSAASDGSRWGESHESLLTLHVLVDGREAMCDNGNRIDGTGIGDCRLRFDVGNTPLITRILTPLVRGGELLRIQALAKEALGSDFDNVTVSLRREASLVSCPRRDYEAEEVHAVYDPDTIGLAADNHLVGCRVHADSFAGGGFWEVRLHSELENRGTALVATDARRLDLTSAGGPQLFDIEVVPRVLSVAPITISPAGGATLTIHGTGFGTRLSDLEVSAAGVACTPTALDAGTIECTLDALLASPAVLSAGDRGASLEWWSIDSTTTDDTSLLATLRALPTYPQAPAGSTILTDMAAPSGCWSERCAGSRLRGWFTAPTSAEYTFLIAADAEAELWCARAPAYVRVRACFEGGEGGREGACDPHLLPSPASREPPEAPAASPPVRSSFLIRAPLE